MGLPKIFFKTDNIICCLLSNDLFLTTNLVKINDFKKLDSIPEMVKYAENNGLKNLGFGSSRMTFLLSSGKVLKIAYAEDVEQNQKEVVSYEFFGSNFVPKVYDYDPQYRWIITESVNTFTPITFLKECGFGDFNLNLWVEYVSLHSKPRFSVDFDGYQRWIKIAKKIPKNVLEKITPKGIELLEKLTFLTKKDIWDIDRSEHWGVTSDQRIVCIDTGL